jgi:hypothetical protein
MVRPLVRAGSVGISGKGVREPDTTWELRMGPKEDARLVWVWCRK